MPPVLAVTGSAVGMLGLLSAATGHLVLGIALAVVGFMVSVVFVVRRVRSNRRLLRRWADEDDRGDS